MFQKKGVLSGRIGLLALVVLAIAHVSTNIDAANNTIKRGQYPFLVSVNNECSGAIISTRHVLTSAHCVEDGSGRARTFVRVNAHDINDSSHGETINVKQTFIHELFNRTGENHNWDLAILELDRSLDSEYKAISLPTFLNKHPAVNDKLKVIGWDQSASGRGCSSVPHKYNLSVVELKQCRILPKEGNICVDKGPGLHGCNDKCTTLLVGEYHFPLVPKFVLKGISTYNMDIGCNPENHPRLFTSVKRNKRWIKKKITNGRSTESGVDEDDLSSSEAIALELENIYNI